VVAIEDRLPEPNPLALVFANAEHNDRFTVSARLQRPL
jgi:hypothetical protein